MRNNVTIQLTCTKINSQFYSGYPLTWQFGDARDDDRNAPAVIRWFVGDVEAEDSLGGNGGRPIVEEGGGQGRVRGGLIMR